MILDKDWFSINNSFAKEPHSVYGSRISSSIKYLWLQFSLKGTNALLCMITGSFVQEYLARKGSDSTEPYSVDAVFSSTSTTNVYSTLNVIILGNLMANKTHNAIIM